MKHYWLLAVMALLAAGVSQAQTPVMNVGLSWTAPTQRTDGSALAPGDITGYRILCGPTSNPSPYPLIHNVGPVTSFSKEDLIAVFSLERETVYYCALRTLAMCGTSSCTSARSGEVSFVIPAETVPQLPPAPPTLTVQSSALAVYTLVQTADRIVLVPVGAAPAGTPCDGTQAVRDVNGLTGYVVPKSAVIWAGTVRSEVVVAECE
jgi:hypothetical protein